MADVGQEFTLGAVRGSRDGVFVGHLAAGHGHAAQVQQEAARQTGQQRGGGRGPQRDLTLLQTERHHPHQPQQRRQAEPCIAPGRGMSAPGQQRGGQHRQPQQQRLGQRRCLVQHLRVAQRRIGLGQHRRAGGLAIHRHDLVRQQRAAADEHHLPTHRSAECRVVRRVQRGAPGGVQRGIQRGVRSWVQGWIQRRVLCGARLLPERGAGKRGKCIHLRWRDCSRRLGIGLGLSMGIGLRRCWQQTMGRLATDQRQADTAGPVQRPGCWRRLA